MEVQLWNFTQTYSHSLATAVLLTANTLYMNIPLDSIKGDKAASAEGSLRSYTTPSFRALVAKDHNLDMAETM